MARIGWALEVGEQRGGVPCHMQPETGIKGLIGTSLRVPASLGEQNPHGELRPRDLLLHLGCFQKATLL